MTFVFYFAVIMVYNISMCLDICTMMIWVYPSSVMFLSWSLPIICHLTYFQTSKGHVTWIIKKVNRIPMHCGVAYESVCSFARGHVVRVWLWVLSIYSFSSSFYAKFGGGGGGSYFTKNLEGCLADSTKVTQIWLLQKWEVNVIWDSKIWSQWDLKQ